MVLLWFLPKRVGAALAASGWRAAVAAHLAALAVGWGLIIWAEAGFVSNPLAPWQSRLGVETRTSQMTWSEWLRGPLIAWAIGLHFDKTGPGGWTQPLLAFAEIEVGVVLLAVAMMPFAAAGERAGRLFGRCLRLTWWSTTMMVPLGVGWLAEPSWQRVLGRPNEWDPVDYAALGLFAMWWAFVWLRSGYRYAGPAEGPAWQARTPRCEKCGYAIVGLPVTTNCPECGRPVAESLPDRRTAPALATAETRAGCIRTFWPTVRAAVFDKTFFDRLAVHRDHARARTFCLTVCLVSAVTVLLGVAVVEAAFVHDPMLGHPLADATILACACFLGLVLSSGLAAALGSAVGRRPLQPVAVATFYALAPLIVVAIGTVVCALASVPTGKVIDSNLADRWLVIVSLSLPLAVGLGGVVLGGYDSARNVVRALRRTRFTNA